MQYKSYQDGRRLALKQEGIQPSERRAMLMDIFQLMTFASFALAVYMLGRSSGKRK